MTQQRRENGRSPLGTAGPKLSRRELARWGALASLAHVLPGSALGPLAYANGPESESKSDSEFTPIFLSGNFAPVHEETTADHLEVVGHLPEDLVGMYVRNGPNPMFRPRGTYHWFDGDGMLHGVELLDGKASYRNRYVRTQGLAAEEKAVHAIYGGLLDPPGVEDLLRGPSDSFKNAGNTALVWHARRFLALWEAGPPHEVRLPSLETVGVQRFDGKLRQPFTAHPKIDPATGEMRFFGYGIMGSMVGYGVVDPTGAISHLTTFRCRYPAMMHDFAVTENYSIFLELPCSLTFEPGKALFAYKPTLGARIGVLPAHGKGEEIRWHEIDPCFVFHTLNAFEEDGKIVLLACRSREFPPVIGPEGATPKAEWNAEWVGEPTLVRWTIDPTAGVSKEEPVDDLCVEFPRVNDQRLGRPTRYGYAMGIDFSALAKYDLSTGKRWTHALGDHRFGGEPLFVARPNPTSEDDGWILTYVFDEERGKSELVVLDAQDFAGEPVARVLLPARVPYGFHGAWIPRDEYVPA